MLGGCAFSPDTTCLSNHEMLSKTEEEDSFALSSLCQLFLSLAPAPPTSSPSVRPSLLGSRALSLSLSTCLCTYSSCMYAECYQALDRRMCFCLKESILLGPAMSDEVCPSLPRQVAVEAPIRLPKPTLDELLQPPWELLLPFESTAARSSGVQ